MLKVLSCDPRGDVASFSHNVMHPRVSHSPEGHNAQEDMVDDGGIRLFQSVVVTFWGHDLTGGISKSL